MKLDVTKNQEPVQNKEPFKGDDRVPAYWDFRQEDGKVYATNSITQNTFEGTMAEFNALMRG
jgi:hypothetical protein